MTWLDGYRMKLVLVGFVVAIGFGGGSARADFTFGEAANLGPPINSTHSDYNGCISSDGLTLYFDSERPGGNGSSDIWEAIRETTANAWQSPVNLGPLVNSSSGDESPNVSANGLELYFCSDRPGGHGSYDLYLMKRDNVSEPWGPPMNLGITVNSQYSEVSPNISSDGLSLFFGESDSDGTPKRPGGYGQGDIWVTTRPSVAEPWGSPVNLGSEVNTTQHDMTPSISADGLILFFARGSYSVADIWLVKRQTEDGPWGDAVKLGPVVSSSHWEGEAEISTNSQILYFTSVRPGGLGGPDIWQVPISPTVDFTGDYQVDIEDLTILIEHWGQNEAAFDMGPTPFGDGVIDAADLEVLMSYWGQPVYDPHLMAHWKLDETEGDVAYDNAGENDGTVMGDAIWQPEGGHVDGALQFDGIDDYIDTLSKLDPADGPFSVFAWIKGGAPGQVIVSQAGGINWLMVDADTSYLKTEVEATGRGSGSLCSDAIINDGNWHRIGLVWDGTHRTLYVDDVAVATDPRTPGALESVNRSLYLGTGANLEPGTFWSGMIDDIRIYDRVVEP